MAKNIYNWNHVKKIREQPHLLGHLCGKDKLTPLHSEWIKYLWESKKDTGLMGHRGSYKSTAVVEVGAIWWLMFNPNARIFIVRKTYTQAASEIRTIAQMMNMDTVRPLLELVWGEKFKFTMLREGQLELSVKKQKTKEPSILALGLDSALVSLHATDVLLDDFVDLSDRVSEAERERTKMIVQEYRTNIIDPGHRCMFNGTPWSKHDAWDMLEHPEDGSKGIEIRRYPVSDTGLLTPEEIADKKSKTTPTLYAINYDLKFESEEGLLFANPHMGEWHEDNTDIKAHIDAAYKGDHYCALTIIGRQKNGRLNVVGWVSPGTIKDWTDFIVGKLLKYGAKELYAEDNADRGYTTDVFDMHPRLQKAGIWVQDYHELEKKHVKITTYLGEVFNQIEFAKESGAEYIEQITDWREGVEPDDSIDGLASIIREGGYSMTAFTNSWNVWSM